MEFTVQVPDDLAGCIVTSGGDLPRRALDALALDEFKCGHITRPELRRALGFATGHQLDGFLKTHEVYEDYTTKDLDRELEGLKRLGISCSLSSPILARSAPVPAWLTVLSAL